MTTIRDVALRAGVSTTTVSHVVNRTRKVEPATAARVEAAIDELGYRPNALARSMRRGKTHTVGVVVPDIANPFFGDLARSLEDHMFEADYSAIICNSDGDSAKEVALSRGPPLEAGRRAAPRSRQPALRQGSCQHGRSGHRPWSWWTGSSMTSARTPRCSSPTTTAAASRVRHLREPRPSTTSGSSPGPGQPGHERASPRRLRVPPSPTTASKLPPEHIAAR